MNDSGDFCCRDSHLPPAKHVFSLCSVAICATTFSKVVADSGGGAAATAGVQ